MSKEVEELDELRKRSPLLDTLLNVEHFRRNPRTWVYRLNAGLDSLDEALKQKIGESWKEYTFKPVYVVAQATHQVFKKTFTGSADEMLLTALLGIGYQIGDADAVDKVGTRVVRALDSMGVLNIDEADLLAMIYSSETVDRQKSYRVIMGVMFAGVGLASSNLSAFEDFLQDKDL